jgi:hypothetical protein
MPKLPKFAEILWQPMADYGSLWQPMAAYGSLWQTMADYGRLWQRYHNTSFSSQFTNGPNKIQCYITQCWKILSGTNTGVLGPFVNYEENEEMKFLNFTPAACTIKVLRL